MAAVEDFWSGNIPAFSRAISDVQISVLQAVASEQSQKIDHI